MNSKKLKVWEAAALLALSINLLIGVWAQGRQQSISSGLLRLHVIAVSDEEQEQQLKLRVRDAVLEYLEAELEGAESPEQAKTIVNERLKQIEAAAKSAAEGRAVTVSLGREYYPTREYQGYTLPAGEYDSLRVILGSGQGKNWWCIVFPPVCLSAADEDRIEQCMSAEDFALVTEAEGYELRFKILELWGQLMNKLS